MIKRELQAIIEKKLFKEKVIIITGARQVGKTTLTKMIAESTDQEFTYLNCDETDIRELLTNTTSTNLKNLVGSKKLVLIDEAQRVKNIGLTLKLFADELKGVQVIATGSSALELSNEINEPLTGRKYEFNLFPFSIRELTAAYGWIDTNRLLEDRILYGLYPEIILKQDERKPLIKEITKNYLFKDILAYKGLRKPEVLEKLLVALAAQIGREVSYNEISNTLGIDKETVSRYIELLEKTFVVFKLRPFSRNLRNEISKMHKIYFYDTGIRNAIISNFNAMETRPDCGALWENFIIAEKMKANTGLEIDAKSYFWRTAQQQEIDYIEEKDRNLSAFEFRWNKKQKKNIPKTFLNTYNVVSNSIIDPGNYSTFLGIK